MLNKFFQKISERLYKENDLSDLTWALCEVSPNFRSWFIQFFFNDIQIEGKIVEIHREYPWGSSRPDFLIKIDGDDHLIEVKVEDQNHHFDQYISDFPEAKRGYITNYTLPTQPGYEVREWSDFYFYIHEKLHFQKLEDQEIHLIQGYQEFLKQICSIHKLQKMTFTNLTSLYDFNLLVRKTIQSISDYKVVLYNSNVGFDQTRYGWYFKIKKQESKVENWPWVGLNFHEETLIYFEVNDKWCKTVFDGLSSKMKSAEFNLTYWKVPYYYKELGYSTICFDLKSEHFDQFNSSETTVEQQQEYFHLYFKEILLVIDPFL